MSELNYSLWFTLVWWIFWTYQAVRLQNDYRNQISGEPEYLLLLAAMIVAPLIATLLEYLIMRLLK